MIRAAALEGRTAFPQFPTTAFLGTDSAQFPKATILQRTKRPLTSGTQLLSFSMRFYPTISFEQYRDTCLAVAAAKAKDVRKRSWKGMVGLGLACLTVGLSPQIPEARVPALVFFAVVALCWIFSKPLARRSQNKCFRAIFAEEQDILNTQIMTIDESGIASDMSDGKVSTYHKWTAFIKRIDLPDAYIFLPSPNSFIRVPKQALSLSDLELVRQWSSIVPSA